MAISYDGCGSYKHSDVCYVCRRDSFGHNEYIPIRNAKPFKNKFGLDLFVVTSDFIGTDGKVIANAGSVTEGMTGMKLCNKSDLDACISKYGIDKVNKLVSDFVEKHGFSPRYSCPDEDKKELFPESDVPSEPKSVLLTPLFIDGNFNRAGKRMRFMFYKTISSVNAKYDLYISASKIPDNNYPKDANDRYFLHVLIDGWVIPCGMTERSIEDRTLWDVVKIKMYGDDAKREEFYKQLRGGYVYSNNNNDAVSQQIQKEKDLEESLRNDSDSIKAEFIRKSFDKAIDNYLKAKDGTGNFPDFVGAVLVGDVENCRVLAEKRREALDKERAERRAAAAEKERIEQEEEARKQAEAIKNAENIFVNGGTIIDGRMICNLADKYGISIPIKTRGWILNSFAKCVFEGDTMSVSYWKKKNGSPSTKVYDILGEIKMSIKNRMEE